VCLRNGGQYGAYGIPPEVPEFPVVLFPVTLLVGIPGPVLFTQKNRNTDSFISEYPTPATQETVNRNALYDSALNKGKTMVLRKPDSICKNISQRTRCLN
jgi:hypothetical protein